MSARLIKSDLRWQHIVAVWMLTPVWLWSGCLNAGVSDCLDAYRGQNFTQAFADCRTAAEEGDADAQFILGQLYVEGQGTAQHEHEGLRWVRAAALQGHDDARFYLALLYMGGAGGYDEEERDWYRKTEEFGAQLSYGELGQISAVAASLASIDADALARHRQAAARGSAEGQFYVGLAHRLGKTVPVDDAIALNWFSKAAEQGLARSQNDLGVAYFQGIGVDQDTKKGLEWISKAAGQGHGGSQLILGNLYLEGVSVDKDLVEAYAWLHLAAVNESPFGKRIAEDRKRLAATGMTAEQIARAEELAASRR